VPRTWDEHNPVVRGTRNMHRAGIIRKQHWCLRYKFEELPQGCAVAEIEHARTRLNIQNPCDFLVIRTNEADRYSTGVQGIDHFLPPSNGEGSRRPSSAWVYKEYLMHPVFVVAFEQVAHSKLVLVSANQVYLLIFWPQDSVV